jgi:regulator of protease activity HflC (stomatin/prohibitin superfamily)
VRAGIRDITFPSDVKKIYTQVGAAEKSAQAQLAKSRAETASLRALANAAKMIEANPNLLALRSLQSISELAASSGNTIVLGVPSPMVPIGGGTERSTSGGAATEDGETERD